jgi:hypothetical protein
MEPIRIEAGDVVMNYFVLDAVTGQRIMRRFICRCGLNHFQGVFVLCRCASPKPIE